MVIKFSMSSNYPEPSTLKCMIFMIPPTPPFFHTWFPQHSHYSIFYCPFACAITFPSILLNWMAKWSIMNNALNCLFSSNVIKDDDYYYYFYLILKRNKVWNFLCNFSMICVCMSEYVWHYFLIKQQTINKPTSKKN